MNLPNDAVQPKNREAWRQWLEHHHHQSSGIWLIIFKKSSGKQVFSFDEAIADALCFGWIDSKPAKLDDERTKLWFTPRKPGSGWSRLNKSRIEAMMVAGLMQQPGLDKINAAKEDGSWFKLDAVEALEIPNDLAAAFESYPNSRENFDAFPPSAKRGILEWITQAKRAQTRVKRIDETARLAAENKRANQWPRQRS